MPANTTMIHIRVDETVKTRATEALAAVGLSVSDAVRILLTRVAAEGGLPAGLAVDPVSYDEWFRAKVQEALDDTGPNYAHEDVMAEAQAIIDARRRA